MKNIFLSIFLLAGLLGSAVAGDESKALQKEQSLLQREVGALRKMKAEALEKLEKSETLRWEARYQQKVRREKYENKTRVLESKYSRTAGEFGRMQSELMQARKNTLDREVDWELASRNFSALVTTVSQSVDKVARSVAHDIPVDIGRRTLVLSEASKLLEGEKPELQKAMRLFLDDRLHRVFLTQRQTLESRTAVVEGKGEVPVWKLTLGTVFSGEVEKVTGGRVQALMRTGSLQGKTFAWRGNLADEFQDNLEQAVANAVLAKKRSGIPLDILQTKSLGSGFSKDNELAFSAAVQRWFESGGLVMYPLLLCALIALLLSFERWLLYFKRGRRQDGLLSEVLPLIRGGKYEAALGFCSRSGGSLSRVLAAILSCADYSREYAEKHAQEVLLNEVPMLEKRLGFIAALGASAPLLGLLGTVSGMITLFKVITDLGTNDARILAGGISEALVTTQTGLVIAIPVLLMHGYLTERLDQIIATLQSRSLAVLNIVWPEKEQES